MTISSSLNAGVAGLAANANRLAAISDNIANSQTHGYKRLEADFQSMVISSGAAAKYTAGGVRSTTQRMIDQSGGLVTTSNPTDIAIQGRGFVPVTDLGSVGLDGTGSPLRLATTGSFRLDENGILRTATGTVLMGWPANADGTIPAYSRDTATDLQPIRVARNSLAGEPTTSMTLGVNLPASDTAPVVSTNSREISVEYYDNLGNSRSLGITMTPQAANTWRISIEDSATGLNIGEYDATFRDAMTGGGYLDTLTYVSGGALDTTTGVATLPVGGAAPANTGTISFNLGVPGSDSGLTQLGNVYMPTGITKDGSPVGNMTGIEIDEGGHLIANFDTGTSKVLYQIPLIDVGNPNSLQALSNQTYVPSADSGGFFLWDAGDGPTGDLVSSVLEASTTDVAGELTNLIQTQRAYSSNAKVIQTVDEMLQETTNIKR